MSFGDRFGMAGVILALFALASQYLWPDKKWIGWLSFSCAVALLIGWGWLELGNELPRLRSRYPVISSVVAFIIGGCLAVALWRLAASPLSRNQTPKLPGEPSLEHPQPPKTDAVPPPSATMAKNTNPTATAPTPKSKAPSITVEQHSSGPESPNVATFGNNSPVTITKKPNPYAAVVWYEFNGVKHIQEGNSFQAIAGDEMSVFPQFGQLQEQKKWQELGNLCEQQIAKSPEWLTPYLFSGIAYANLGQKDKAIERLEYVERQSAGNEAYRDASRLLQILRDTKPQ